MLFKSTSSSQADTSEGITLWVCSERVLTQHSFPQLTFWYLDQNRVSFGLCSGGAGVFQSLSNSFSDCVIIPSSCNSFISPRMIIERDIKDCPPSSIPIFMIPIEPIIPWASSRASSYWLRSLDAFPDLIFWESLFLSMNPRDLIIPEVKVPSDVCVLNDFIRLYLNL